MPLTDVPEQLITFPDKDCFIVFPFSIYQQNVVGVIMECEIFLPSVNVKRGFWSSFQTALPQVSPLFSVAVLYIQTAL